MYINADKALKVVLLAALLGLTACAGQRAEQEALLAQQQAAAAQAAELAERAELAELARLEAERNEQALREELERLRLESEALAVAREAAEREAEQRARQAAELQRQQQQTEVARVQQQQQSRITALERQLAATEETVRRREQANARLAQAITAAEELLQMLASEQLKYESLDAQGNTVEPLQKALISELEARKNALVREAQALGN
jgi:hypothetical protein